MPALQFVLGIMETQKRNAKRFYSNPATLLACVLTILALVTCEAPQVNAEVNLKNASYTTVAIDQLDGLTFRRRYDSRSMNNGLFGFGWCADFEVHLKRESPRRILLQECGNESAIVYLPSAQALFRAKDRPLETLSIGKNGGVQRVLADGTLQLFDRDGHLSFELLPSGASRTLTYDRNGFPVTYSNNRGQNARFTIDPIGRHVLRLTSDTGFSLTYRYAGENLIEVRNQPGLQNSYGYDELHNMIENRLASGVAETMSYDRDQDWVINVKNILSCEESFRYLPSFAGERRHFVTLVRQQCPGEPSKQSRFEFWHQSMTNGQTYLAKIKISRGTAVTEVIYHPEFGLPTLIKREGLTRNFAYDSLGRIIQIDVSNIGTMQISYSASGAIDQLNVSKGDSAAWQLARNLNDLLQSPEAQAGLPTRYF